MPWLTLLLVVPVGAALLLQLIPRHATGAVKALTVLSTAVSAAIVLGLLIAFTQNPVGHQYVLPGGSSSRAPLTFQFEEHRDWIPKIGAAYHLGIDGLSAWLVALDAAVFLLGAVVVSRRATDRLRLYCGLLLLTQAATMGVLLSLDLLLFYLFWEGMLIPLYFILGMYGGRDRGRATLKFVIYTVAGSLLMLLSIIFIYFDQQASARGNPLSFDLPALVLNSPPAASVHDAVSFSLFSHSVSLGLSARQCAFLGFALAFAIKIPLVPFHTWLPDSYANAPASTLAFFAGIVSKLGAFGLVRYGLTLFPGPVQDFHFIIEALAVAGIIYGALLALAQTDIKRIVAYSSISHLGFITLGIFALDGNGLNGAIIQMVNHGIIISALFLIVAMIEERTGTRDRRELAGLERRMPWLYGFFLVVTLAGLGMPGMNTFVGEFTILLGAFQSSWVFAVLAGVGVVLAAWYMLRLHQGLMHEPLQSATERVRDLRVREGAVLLPLAALMVLIGVFPKPIGDISHSTAQQYVRIATAPQPEIQGASAAVVGGGGATQAGRTVAQSGGGVGRGDDAVGQGGNAVRRGG